MQREKLIDAGLWLSCLFLTVTIVVTSLASPPAAMSFPGADKLYHFGSYLLLTLLLLLAAVWRPGRGSGALPDKGMVVLVGAVTLGIVLELGQLLVSERSAHIFDAVANMVGVTAAWIVWTYLLRSPRVDP